MNITIKINCDNDAFQDNNMTTEVASILEMALEAIGDGKASSRLYDSNGNPIGSVEVQS